MAVSGSYLSALFTAAVPDMPANPYGRLFGAEKSSNPFSKADAIRNLRQAEADKNKRIAETAKEPQVKREIAAFRAGVAQAASAEELLSNPAVMKVLLGANGLTDQEPYLALARKALLSDPSDDKALVNKLSDRRWKSVALTYQFGQKGMAILRDPKVLDTIAQAYAEISWRKSLDETTPGLSDALAFREQAGKVQSTLQILGDPVLRRVVTTALGLPLEIAFQSLEAQQKAVDTRLDITRLHDPKFLESFTQRFLMAALDKAAADTKTSGMGLLI